MVTENEKKRHGSLYFHRIYRAVFINNKRNEQRETSCPWRLYMVSKAYGSELENVRTWQKMKSQFRK